MKTLLLLAALSTASPAFASELTCDYNHAAFKRDDGATIASTMPVYNPLARGWETPVPEGVFADDWVEANGIDGVIGFAVLYGNCGDPGCVAFIPVDAAGNEITEGGGALTSDGEDAGAGSDDPAPLFIQIDDFGTFYRECHRGIGH